MTVVYFIMTCFLGLLRLSIRLQVRVFLSEEYPDKSKVSDYINAGTYLARITNF